MIDSVIKANKKYYPQTLLYVQEKIRTENHIDDELNSNSNDETESNIDNDK